MPVYLTFIPATPSGNTRRFQIDPFAAPLSVRCFAIILSPRRSSVKAFRQADLAPHQVDLWELWDAFSIETILAREAIGLAPSA